MTCDNDRGVPSIMKRAGMPARRDADVVPKQEVIY
eukprot:CAMPEP_0195603302 /NCGR_PEP_ID=MMETSP0815-20121206/6057_1 /TAXON_ID=97485 /ORGANISM="Prymnesium parvum, Strain Texoma1" /LENGTH=34 /DNA_ID= /DNA_START= /DNA_END= /DNA_ORIENTATION=